MGDRDYWVAGTGVESAPTGALFDATRVGELGSGLEGMPMGMPSSFGSVRVANGRLKGVLEDLGEIGHVQGPQVNSRTVAIPSVNSDLCLALVYLPTAK